MSQIKASLLVVFLAFLIVSITESKKNADDDNSNGMMSKIGRIFTGVLALSSVAPDATNASQTGGAVQAVHQQQWTPPPQVPGRNLVETPVSMKNREISKSSETAVYGQSKHEVPNGPNPIQNRHKKGHF